MINAGLTAPPVNSPVIDRRSVTDADRDFLFGLFCSALAPEDALTALTALPQAERESILRMQFDAREQQYRASYLLADFDVILRDGKCIGNIYADRGDDAYTLIDISVVPEFRNQGIGTAVVGDLLEEASRLALPVRAHVQKHNPAWRLWQRLGFEKNGDDGVYYDIVVPALPI